MALFERGVQGVPSREVQALAIVNDRHVVSIEQGFLNAGFEVTTKEWLDRYDELMEAAQKEDFEKIMSLAEKEGIYIP